MADTLRQKIAALAVRYRNDSTSSELLKYVLDIFDQHCAESEQRFEKTLGWRSVGNEFLREGWQAAIKSLLGEKS